MNPLNLKRSLLLRLVIPALFFLSFLSLLNPQAYANVYYVANSGSDSNSVSFEYPWATPRNAWANAQAGDIVYFRGGTYYITSEIDTASIGHDGTASAPITFTHYADEDVYFNVNIIKLLQNYRSAYIQLIRHFLNRGQKDDASNLLDEMSRKIPANHVPYSHERLAVMVADFYKRVGRSPEADKQREFILPGTGLSNKERLLLQSYHAQAMKDWDQAEEYLLQLVEEDANDAEAVSELLRMYHHSKQYEKGIEILENWLQRNPGDPNARKQLDLLRSMVSDQSAGIVPDQGE